MLLRNKRCLLVSKKKINKERKTNSVKMKNKIINYCLALVLLLFFVGCRKKYPENTMKLFQNPKGYDLMRGFITSYKVSGVDSLQYLNIFQNPNNIYCSQNISEMELMTANPYSGRNVVSHSCIGKINYNWTDNYNYIFIYYEFDNVYLKKNLFLESGMKWKILKLIPSKNTTKHTLKIELNYNNNLYEIQFN